MKKPVFAAQNRYVAIARIFPVRVLRYWDDDQPIKAEQHMSHATLAAVKELFVLLKGERGQEELADATVRNTRILYGVIYEPRLHAAPEFMVVVKRADGLHYYGAASNPYIYCDTHHRGRFYGFPECCVQGFGKENWRSRAERKLNGTGYIPCVDCTERKSEKELVDAITAHRICTVPFPGKPHTRAQVDVEYILAQAKGLVMGPDEVKITETE